MNQESLKNNQINANMRKVALTALAGTSIEWYDFFLYGAAAALIFPAAFFSENIPPATALILSLLTFAAGFIARPIGGIIFGHFGDKIGRKKNAYQRTDVNGDLLDINRPFTDLCNDWCCGTYPSYSIEVRTRIGDWRSMGRRHAFSY